MTEGPYRFLRSWRFWVAVVVVWTAYGLALAQESRSFAEVTGETAWPLTRYILHAIPDVGMWLWATPLTIVLARRFPITRSRWVQPLILHLVFAVCVALGTAAGTFFLMSWWLSPPSRSLAGYLLYQLDPGVFVYCGIVGLVHAMDFYRMYASERLAAATLRAGLSEARLQVLSAQLQPHFLFNTLNVISELVHEDPDRADEMIGRLGDLLRESMSGGVAEQSGVPLERELATLKAYVDIQQLRFRDRLDVSFEISEQVRAARVPHFALQPLVENAIRHGFAGHVDVVRVHIQAQPDGDRIRIRVVDDGQGISGAERRTRGGLGLRTVQARLGQMFGGDYSLELKSRTPRGAESVLSIPFVHCGSDGSHGDGAATLQLARD